MSKAAVPKLQPEAEVSCPPKPITFLVFSAESCLSGYIVVHKNVNVIHSPKSLGTSGLMLASVSHKICSVAKVSLVYNYQYQLSSSRLPPRVLLSLGPVLRGAQPLKSTGTEGLGTLRC